MDHQSLIEWRLNMLELLSNALDQYNLMNQADPLDWYEVIDALDLNNEKEVFEAIESLGGIL